MLRSFFQNVAWGPLDTLFVDFPPGTSDEHIAISQLLRSDAGHPPHRFGAVIVTTAQRLAILDVEKQLDFCRRARIPVLGIVENMHGFLCPACRTLRPLWPRFEGGGPGLAARYHVPFLGAIPYTADIHDHGAAGTLFHALRDGPAAAAIQALAAQLLRAILAARAQPEPPSS